jgi:hypothetical protein
MHGIGRLKKWKKSILAILLFPFCLGSTSALFKLIKAIQTAETIWVAFLAGVTCWIVIYLLLPKPMWIYVFGHELTHVLWVWVFGGKVKRFQATSKGGRVVVTKSNFFIALAPYFFPIYAFGIAILFVAGDWIWGWSRYLVYLDLLIGVAYAFHVTMTWQVLKTRQSDLEQHGYLFSAVVIWLANVVTLLIAISLLTAKVDMLTALGWCWTETNRIILRVGAIF